MDKCASSASKPKMAKEEKRNVQSFVRVRPLNGTEKATKSFSIVNCSQKEVTIKERSLDKLPKTFSFDKVFGPESKQLDVYKSVVRPLIEEVLAGYNCTVFAYGQTGTGKTFTMEGEKTDDPDVSWDNDPLSGIIPRAMSHLFDELRLLQAEYTVRVSFLELYNEELFDLLSASDDTSKLRIFEDTTRKGSVIIQGLEEVMVHSKQEVYRILEKGSLKRNTAATLMNAQSSRSHTVFSITVHIKDNSVDGEELLRTGKLNLVDLAGSENIGRSGAVDKRAREAGNINQSLLTLGRVITSLVEHAPHVPYRESKLTRLLQDSLGGRTKTSIIATISPAACNLEETLSTLDYAHRAKNITNKPEINQKLTKRALLKEYTEEIERLKRDLEATREKNGVHIAPENYTLMIQRLEEQENEIMDKISTMKAIKEEMDKKEDLLSMLNMKLDKAKDIIHKTITERDESKHLIEKHKEVEKKLIAQAKELQAVVHKSTDDNEKLHQRLETKNNLQNMNKQAGTNFVIKFDTKIKEFEEKLSSCDKKRKEFFEEQQDLFRKNLQDQEEMLRKIQNTVGMLDQFIQGIHYDNEEFKKKNSFYQKSIEDHHENVNSLAHYGHEGLRKILSIKNDLDSIIGYLKLIEQSQLELKNNTDKSNEVLSKCSNDVLQLKSDFTKHKDYIQDAVTLYLQNLEKMQIAEDEFHANNTHRNNEILNRVSEQEETIKQYENCMMNLFAGFQDKMIRHSTSIKSMASHEPSHRHRNEITDCLSQTSSNLKNVGQVEQRQFENIRHQLDHHRDQIVDFQQNFTNETKHILHRSQDGVKHSQVTTHSIQDMLEKFTNKQCNRIVNYEKQWSDSFNELSSTLKDELNAKESRTQELNIKAETVIVEAGTHIAEVLSNDNRFCASRVEDLKNETNDLNNDFKTLRNILTQQSNVVQNYVNHELKYDFPTGQTPPRRNLKYPQQLAAMSPYERILCRFRNNRSADYDNVDSEIDLLDVAREETSVHSNNSNDKIESESDKTSNDGDEDEIEKENFPNLRSSSLGDIKYGGRNLLNVNCVNSAEKILYRKKSQNGVKVLRSKNVFKKPFQKK